MEASSDGETAVEFPTETTELGVKPNSNQTHQFAPGDSGPEKWEASCVTGKMDYMDSCLYPHRKISTQAHFIQNVEPGASGLHLPWSYAQIPCYSISASLWYLHRRTLHKRFISRTWRQRPGELRDDRGKRRTPEYPLCGLSGCCEDRATQTRTPHFCDLCSAFSCPWEGEGRFNMPSTDQILLACIRHLLPVYLKLLTRVKYTGLLELGGKKVKIKKKKQPTPKIPKNSEERKKGERHCKMINDSYRQWEASMNIWVWRRDNHREWNTDFWHSQW